MTTPDLTPSGGEPIAVEFRVTLPWRKAGCEGWRVSDAKKRLRLLEYDRLEVRYSDGRVETLPTPPDAITTDTQDVREALRERVAAVILSADSEVAMIAQDWFAKDHALKIAEAILAALPLQENGNG